MKTIGETFFQDSNLISFRDIMNANNRISIGLYSETSKITTVKNPQRGGGLRVAYGL